LERAPQVRGVYPVRSLFPATVVSDALGTLGATARPEIAARLRANGAGVRVALLDGPIDRRHPYLKGRLLPGWNEVSLKATRVKAPAAGESRPLALRHATAMAGVLVGSGGPDGLRGVAPRARVLPIQVLGLRNRSLVGTTGSLLAGLDRALDPNGDGSFKDR